MIAWKENKICPQCGKEFFAPKKRVCCSKSCSAKFSPRGKIFVKGEIVWNKGLTKETDEIIEKYASKSRGKYSEKQREGSKKSADKRRGKPFLNWGGKTQEEKEKSKTKISFTHKGKKKKPTTEKTKLKLSEALIGIPKSEEYKKNMSAIMKEKGGHSPERIDAIIEGLRKSRKKPKEINKIEARVFKAFETFGLKYTGIGKIWVKFKDGKYKNPDFVWGDYKIAIEVFGDYWHKGEDPNELVKKYEEIGWRCLVLWEKDIKSQSDFLLTETINEFINYDNYEPHTNRYDNDYAERHYLRR